MVDRDCTGDRRKDERIRLVNLERRAREKAERDARNAALEEAASVAEHLNGWGPRDGTAEHIAKCIRELKR